LSKHAVNRRVKAGNWLRCAPGVYFADDRPFTDSARVRATVWSYGHRAVASGLAAAWWHGLTRFAPDVIEVTVPRDSNGRCRAGSRLRRRDLAPADIVERMGLRVTALPLTVVEAAARRGGGAKLMDSALQRHVELPQLWSAHLRNKGRYGSPAARRLLQAASDGARSEAERLLIKLLRDNGITGWKANYPVGGYKVDVAFPKQKVAIETDGWAFHSSQEDFQNDRERQNKIALLGWQVLRFTWLDLTEYPQRVLALIRRAISAC
jgi:very-short-patch-repair endonuclease